MPFLEPESDDPHEIVGVGVPAPDDGSVREMARCFVEEYMRLGFSADKIRAMFEKPFYAGAHQAYRVLGAAVIDRVIQDRARILAPAHYPSLEKKGI